MSSRSACNSSGHVLLKLQVNMSCSSTCSMSVMFCRNFTERHVLLEVMFYLRVCIVGGHILLLEMSY